MEHAECREEEPEVAIGPKTGPPGELSSKSSNLELDSPVMEIKDEAAGESMKATTGPKKKRRRLPPVAKGTWRPVLGPLHSSPDKTQLEQYMNESLQQWFRLEFLMDYDYQGNKLHCMMCTITLPSLSLTDIKNHILDNHPTSLQLSPTQKSVILDAWINRKGSPDVEVEEGMTPDVEVDEDMTPEFDLEEDTTPEMEMEDDMDDDEAEEKLASEDVKDDGVAQTTTKPRPENRVLKAKHFGHLMERNIDSVQHLGEKNINNCKAQLMEQEKLEPSDLELLEEEEPITEDVHLLDNEEWSAKDVQLLADEEWKARKKHLLESVRIAREQQKASEEGKREAREGQFIDEEKNKTKERPLPEEEEQREEKEKARKAALLEEEQQKAREAKLLDEEKKKAKEAKLLEEEKRKAEEDERNAKEAQLLEEEKKAAMEAQLLEEEKRKIKEAQLLEDETKKAREAQLLEEEIRKAKEAQLMEEEEEEKLKTIEAQPLEEQGIKEAMKLKEEDETLKEEDDDEFSREVQNMEPEIVVKVEDHQYAELTKSEKEERQPEKQQIPQKIMEVGKIKVSEPENRVIQVQQVHQASTVLGIGLPMLKVETPTPIIITRVSVIPEHTILQAAKPKPSTSSDITKTWRFIAPKVSPADSQSPKPPSASLDLSQSPAGVDPTVWEVGVWRGNNGNLAQNNAYQMRWRSEYLMDFNGVRGSVVCMYCSSSLTVLKESSIKRHIVQKHPHTANFSGDEKAAIILDWENKLSEIKKIAAKPNQDGVVVGDQGLNIIKAPDVDPVDSEEEEEECTWTGVLPEGKGSSWEFAFGRLQATVKDPRKYQHDRWKLEFLMDYTPAKDGLICMVCGTTLMNPKISTVKMHIQQKHPDTTYLSDQEKAVVMEEWEQKITIGKRTAGQQHSEDEICIEINEDSTASETNGSSGAASSPRPELILPAFSKAPKSTPSLPPPCNSARRNYQVRWRTEFMMDYDCRRQGLICMVCGGTLATLKVSTIKRHIVQVHPYSVDFTSEERQRILEAYSEMALHYIHSEECFKTQPQEEVKGRKRKSTAMDES